MRLGIWTPAPLSMRPDAVAQPAIDALTRHGGGVDQNYLYALDTLQRAEELGFSLTLIAQRFLGPDLDSWIFASALAAGTKTIEIMPAVHPGIMDPRIAAKMGAPPAALLAPAARAGGLCLAVRSSRRCVVTTTASAPASMYGNRLLVPFDDTLYHELPKNGATAMVSPTHASAI
jgi:hypothetical protein